MFLKKGVRQGCPAAAITFALALDPIFRWLSDRALRVRDDIRGYADDLALYMEDVFDNLALVASAFEVISNATGLTLKICKCGIVLLGKLSKYEVSQWIQANVVGFKDIAIGDVAKYLGVHIGPGAFMRSWEDPLQKYYSISLDVRQMGLGLARTCILYNRHCVPVLQFIAQLLDPSTDVLRMQKMVLDRLVVAPRHALNKDMLTSLKSLGMGFQFVDIARYALAAKARLAASSDAVTHALLKIDQTRLSDEALLASTRPEWMPPWFETSCLGSIVRADTYVNSVSGGLANVRLPAAHSKDFQSKVCDLLEQLGKPCHVQAMLLWRMGRWLPAGIYPDMPTLVLRIKRIGNRHKLWGPSVAVLCICSRAVCTASRFQDKIRRCRFGCNEGPDSIEHIFLCPVVVKASTALMHRLRIRMPFELVINGVIDHSRLLMYDGREGDARQDTMFAILADAIIQAHNAARVQSNDLGYERTLMHFVSRLKHYRTISASMAGDITSCAVYG